MQTGFGRFRTWLHRRRVGNRLAAYSQEADAWSRHRMRPDASSPLGARPDLMAAFGHLDETLDRELLEVEGDMSQGGQKDASVRNPAPSAALADLLLALVAGLRVNARADFGAARLQRTVDLALAVLDSG